MKSTDFSPQFSEVWGENAASDTITYPIPTSTTTSGRASLDAGFSSVNMTALAAGGIPPFGQDFNGILKMLSTSSRNYESGNVPTWSSDFATSIGGYPEYSLVLYNGNYYVSTSDSNTSTPGASGASWKSLFDGYAQLNQPANFKSLSTTDTLALSDNGNNVPTTYWVKAQGYALSSDIPSLAGYVTGTATTNVSVSNLQAVNYTGTDNSAAYIQVATAAGTVAIPTNGNVAGQISAYAQPKGSYVTTGTYANDFDSSGDSRVQFFAYGKMQVFDNIGTVSDGYRVTFPRAFSSTPVVIGVSNDTSDINGHPYSPDPNGFYVHKNGGGTINFAYIAIGEK